MTVRLTTTRSSRTLQWLSPPNHHPPRPRSRSRRVDSRHDARIRSNECSTCIQGHRIRASSRARPQIHPRSSEAALLPRRKVRACKCSCTVRVNVVVRRHSQRLSLRSLGLVCEARTQQSPVGRVLEAVHRSRSLVLKIGRAHV